MKLSSGALRRGYGRAMVTLPSFRQFTAAVEQYV
ncbi:hypothetical protein TcWFU_003856, partial [Taenia crassiceps]